MDGFTFNPILSEIQGHIQSMSPDAQAVVAKMGGNAQAPSTASPSAAPVIPHGMLLPQPDDGPPQGTISMESPAPSLSGFPTSTPPTVKAPRGTIEGDTNERGMLLGQKPGVENIAHNVEGSRFGQAHPFLGKLLGGAAEGAGMVGDTLLHAAAPGLERMVPGTEGNYSRNLGRANTALTQDTENAQKEAQAANENATAGKTNAETPEVAPEAEAKIGAENATAGHENAETANLQNPAPKYEETPSGPMMIHPDGTAQHVTVDGKPIGAPVKLTYQTVDAADGPHVYGVDEKGNKVVDLGKHYERPAVAVNAGEKEGQNFFVPDGKGGTKMIRVKPGEPVPAGAQTAPGLNSTNTPTMTQRTAAGRAETVLEMAPEVLARIDATAKEIGPLSGRWDKFMQGTVGAPDAPMAELRSDLLMMSSAVALAHAQGRLPENLRQEFDHAINAPQQSPENLKATIQTMLPWLQKMQEQAHPNQAQPQGGGDAENWVRGADGKLVKQ
jgi:hypothetical protein